jgi:hypothetical protein
MSEQTSSESRVLSFNPRRNVRPAEEERTPQHEAPEGPRTSGNTFVTGLLRQGYYNAVAYMNALTARQS